MDNYIGMTSGRKRWKSGLRASQRVRLNYLYNLMISESKYIMKKQSQILSNSAFVYRILWITNLLEIQGNPSSILEKSPLGFGFNRIN
jgi:hypothetical protein